ncbi:heme-based aerotactic transducer HemAT [Siminovitchia terrae]|uniref:Chemotaxis protein n=1 Tax=Siminovitchia terrae TaxID=1914933 RepID=A0A429X5M4_SIMTE|nr:globin-coupled sensor protein [Siminovitchia terrae]RST58707.1 chemotaxis protein [Siminovitchia terrae]GIN90017.1 heme-based aerotactic transducer HemAT [Siminovitchia terrae]GIN94463.1 heme-based aerotactic transducer HemAT [Siminovitchia terrae]
MSFLGIGKSTSKKEDGINHSEKVNTKVGTKIEDTSILDKINMINLTEKDLKLLKSIQPLVKENIERLVDEFYSVVLKVASLKKIIQKNSTVERLKKTLRVHIIEMFDGNIDQSFIDKRLKIAKVHYVIGLEPAWYMGSFQGIHDTITHLAFKNIKDKRKLQSLLSAVNKILSLEQQIVLEAYDRENMLKLNAQFEEGKIYLKNQMTSVSEGLVALAEQTQASVAALSKNIREVNETTTENNEQSILAKNYAQDGQHKLKELLEKISVMDNYSRDMIESIHRLGESSDQISSVIHIVQDIAEQTNILALNSAIEAARAGEHGRGFAVLSQEVQSLAEQTKNSISQIHELISNSNLYKEQVIKSLKHVEEALMSGIATSEHTHEAFQNIAQSIQQNSMTNMKVQEQMDQLVAVVNEIENASAIVTSSAEQLNEAAMV